MNRDDRPLVDGLGETGLRLSRALMRSRLQRRYDVHEHGLGNVPESGPVILASNHVGWLDGPLLVGRSPRPVHALVKSEAWEGRTARFLRFTSQIKVDRKAFDTAAVRSAVRALTAGQVVGIYPEAKRGNGDFATIRRGTAWLALATGAPVVPVAVFGTRAPGADIESKPEPGTRLDLVFGAPITVPQRSFPRDSKLVETVSEQIHSHLRDHLAWAKSVVSA